VPLATIQELARYWATDYDWRKCEAKLNALPQFMTEIDGLDIHFIHIRSQHDNALPLIVTHGWPGSIFEQLKIIDPLINPTPHGASASDAFHLVIPSLPGYGFSGKPTTTGWDPAHVARAWVVLMKRLGYPQFASQGGDWGGAVTNVMGEQAPPGLLGARPPGRQVNPQIRTAFAGAFPLSVRKRVALYIGPEAAPRLSSADRLDGGGSLHWSAFANIGRDGSGEVDVFPGENYEAPRSWTERAYHGADRCGWCRRKEIGYLIGSQQSGRMPLPPKAELQWWYQFYFATERGRDGYDKYRRDFSKLIWQLASPQWAFDDATFDRSAAAFDNPDHVAVVIHNYRWRLGLAEGESKYDDLEKRLAQSPAIAVPTITLEGDANGAPHPEPSSYAQKFSGKYEHRTITGGIGHNLPQEAPQAFAQAIVDFGAG